MRIKKYDMLLFCMERSTHAYALYFVEFDTLDDISPRIHRFSIDPLAFETFSLGGVYFFDARGTRIVSSRLDGYYELSDSDYLLLMELRAMRFGDVRAGAFHPEDYYTFAETKAIVDYRDPLRRSVPLLLLRLCAYIAALLVPFLLYVWLLYGVFLARAAKGLSVGGPLFAVSALPLMAFLMSLLFVATNQFFLRWPVSRYGFLRQYVLRGAGQRKAVVLSGYERRRFLKAGLISLCILSVGFLLSLLL